MAIFHSYVFLLASIFLLVVIGILISLLGEKDCLSQNCRNHALFIHKSMNENVDPCDDFYSFVCGKFKKFGITVIDQVSVAQIKRLIKYLKRPYSWKDEDRVLHIAKLLYQNCNNDTQLEFEGIKPARRLISKIGGIPFLDPYWDPKEAEFGLPDTELIYYRTGFKSIFVHNKIVKTKLYPLVPPKIETPMEVLGRHYFSFSIPPYLVSAVAPDPEKYVNYCVEFNILYNKMVDNNKIITEKQKEELKEAAQFKIELLKLIDRTKNCSDQPIEFKTYDDIEKLISFKKRKYLQSDSNTLLEYITFKAGQGNVDIVLVTANFVKYIKGVDKLLKRVPDRVLANYMGVEALTQMTPFLPREFREIYNKYLASDQEKNSAVLSKRELYCAKLVKDEITSGLSALYLKDNPNAYKHLPSLPVLELKEKVKAIIKKNNWASQTDRKKMFRLVRNIKIVSPLPNSVMEKLKDMNVLEKLYSAVCISSTLETYVSLRKVKMASNLQILKYMLGISAFDEDYDIFGTEIYFHSDSNSVVVPMGYFFYPSHDPLWPRYLSFGGVAVWIVRLIINTVGYYNVLYPEIQPEQPVNQNWWEEKTVSNYISKRRCVLNEYNQFLRHSKVKCKDSDCLEETLSNTAAVKAAYFAYRKNVERRFFQEPKIPYMKKYSPDKIFFIKYVSSFCRYDELGLKQYRTDIDTARVPNNFTVISSLRNFPVFSKVFECNQNDKMIKTTPCETWAL